MKVAVTGASGHVGNVLSRELVNKGIEVVALVHKDKNDLERIGVRIVKGDLLDLSSLEMLCQDADVVYHLAAKISIDERARDKVYLTNVEGTRNVISVCLKTGINRLVHFSSIHALDPFPLEEVLDENRPMINHSRMIYEQSKTESEKLVLEAAKSGLNAVIITPTAIIGPYDHHPSFLGRALIQIYKNTLPMLVPGGYNWVDVRDVADAAIRAAEVGRTGERYIISGTWLSLKELSQMIGEVTKRKTPTLIVPSFIAALGVPFIQFYAVIRNEQPLYTRDSLEILNHSNRKISCKKAQMEFGYYPRSIELTLKDTFDWFINAGLIK
jgi:dihydroflavonol-4-reductase